MLSEKLPVGTRVETKKYDDRTKILIGTVVTWGRKWVEIKREDKGTYDYGFIEETKALPDGNKTTIQPDKPKPESAIQTAAERVAEKKIEAEEISPFTALAPGSIVSYRPAEDAGTYYGLFKKYEKWAKRVTIETIPAFKAKPTVIVLREHLVEVEEPKIPFVLDDFVKSYMVEIDTEEGWETVAEKHSLAVALEFAEARCKGKTYRIAEVEMSKRILKLEPKPQEQGVGV